MVPQSRRAILRNSAVTLSAIGAGCLASNEDGAPTKTTPTRTATESTTSESPTPDEQFPPDVDERVERTPPGSPALDPGGEWPSYRYDNRNTGANPAGSGVRHGTTYWRLNAGKAATFSDGRLYNVYGRDQDRADLTVRDGSTAAVTTRAPLVEHGVNDPPVVADGRVFVTTFIGVFCFDAESGEELWRGPAMDGIQGQPTVAEGRVLVNSGGFKSTDPHLRAFDAASGEELWRYDTGGESKSTPAVGEGLVFVSSVDGVHAIELPSGAEEFVLEAEQDRWATPVYHDGTVYSVANDHDGTELVAVGVEDTSVRWRVPVDDDSPPVVTDERVYAAGVDGLAALDPADGAVLESTTRAIRPLALAGDVLYGADSGTIYALDAEDLSPLWRKQTERVQISDTVGRFVHHITPVDDAVFVYARDAFYGIGPVSSEP